MVVVRTWKRGGFLIDLSSTYIKDLNFVNQKI